MELLLLYFIISKLLKLSGLSTFTSVSLNDEECSTP